MACIFNNRAKINELANTIAENYNDSDDMPESLVSDIKNALNSTTYSIRLEFFTILCEKNPALVPLFFKKV